MTFGERLTELRISNGYPKRNELAEKLGIPSTTLRNYETGAREPGHTFLKQISEFFNVSVDYLLGLTDEKEVLNSFRLKTSEYTHIEKYRNLDDYGRETVDLILERESQRTSTIADQADRIAKLEQKSKVTQLPGRSYLEPVAAHERTDIEVTDEMREHDDAIMENDDEWNDEWK